MWTMDKYEMRARVRQVLERYAKSPTWTPRQEMGQSVFWKRIRGEFIGCVIVMVLSSSSDAYLGPISYGCVVTVLTYALSTTPSTNNPVIHFNPVLTLAALLLHDITAFRCASSMIAQTLGTISGAAIVSLGLSANSSTPINLPILAVNPTTGFGFELFGTLLVVLTAAPQLDRNKQQPVDILFPVMLGLAHTTASAAARPGTGGFLNPLRAFALALFRGGECRQSHHIYWLGPILGGLLAVFTYDFVRPTCTTSSQSRSQDAVSHEMRNSGATNLALIRSAMADSDTVLTADTELTIATLT